MHFKNFLETCQNFGYKYWCANSLAMNQLMTTNFGMPWFWLGKNSEALWTVGALGDKSTHWSTSRYMSKDLFDFFGGVGALRPSPTAPT